MLNRHPFARRRAAPRPHPEMPDPPAAAAPVAALATAPAIAPAAAIAPADDAAEWRVRRASIFLGWETLRVPFNLLLGGLCSPLALLRGDEVFASQAFWGNCLAGVVLVNAAYFAGPVAEVLLDLLGLRHRAVRWGLFLSAAAATGCFAALSVWYFPTVIGPF